MCLQSHEFGEHLSRVNGYECSCTPSEDLASNRVCAGAYIQGPIDAQISSEHNLQALFCILVDEGETMPEISKTAMIRRRSGALKIVGPWRRNE